MGGVDYKARLWAEWTTRYDCGQSGLQGTIVGRVDYKARLWVEWTTRYDCGWSGLQGAVVDYKVWRHCFLIEY